MKKRTIFRGVLMAGIVLVTLFMSSCKSDKAKLPIPEKSPFVVEIDMKSLAQKSDFDEKREEIVALLEKNKVQEELIEMISKEGQTGLDLEKPLYIFADEDFKGVYALAYVDDEEKLIDNLKTLDDDDDTKIKEDDDVKWIYREDRLFGAITKDYLLVGQIRDYYDEEKDRYVTHDVKAQKKAFKKLLEGGGFFESETGKLMAEHAGDVTLAVNFGAFSEDVMDDLTRSYRYTVNDEYAKVLTDRVKKIKAVVNLEFRTGEVAMTAYMEGRNENMDGAYKKITKEAFAQIPNSNLVALVAFGLEGKELANNIRKEIKTAKVDLDTEASVGVALMLDILKTISGTAAVSMALRSEHVKPHVVAVLPLGEEKSQEILSSLDEFTHGEVSEDMNRYHVSMAGDKNYTAITNMRSYEFGKVKYPFSAASHAAGCYAYAFADIQQIVAILMEDKDFGDFEEAERYKKAVKKFAGLFDYVELKAKSMNEMTLTLQLSEDSGNALDVIILNGMDFIEEIEKYQKAKSEYNRRHYYDY